MFKETKEDVAVKDQLWKSIKAEVMRFSQKCAECHMPGVKYSERQKDVTDAAKQKGYPKGMIRAIASHIRAGRVVERDAMLRAYRASLGLGAGRVYK